MAVTAKKARKLFSQRGGWAVIAVECACPCLCDRLGNVYKDLHVAAAIVGLD